MNRTNFIYGKLSKNKKEVKVSDKNQELIQFLLDECSKNLPDEWIKYRGYNKELIKKLGIGIATVEVKHALREKYELETLIRLGIFSGKLRARFTYTDRIIIPYGNYYYSARSQNPKEKPEYKNLFPKKELAGDKKPYYLNGENDHTLIFCEGETDAIALKHIYPEHNILGVGGVQTAKKYIEKIPETVKNIIICFDNDEPGEKAKQEILNLLSETEYNLETIIFPKEFKDIDEVFREYNLETINKIELKKETINVLDDRFKQPNLLDEIHKELDYKHKLDHKEKIALFLIGISSYLKNPNDHCSAALKGDSSAGKDNAIKTILVLLPKEDSFLLTRGTQSALEREANNAKIIAFSEINKHRDNGANSELTEVFKQLAEGGTNVIKVDKKTDEVINVKSEQKTLFYGTTETETDDELETRYVIIPIKSDTFKNQIVVNDVLKKVSSEEHHLREEYSCEWITNGIKKLRKNVEVIIPFANLFQEKIYDSEDKKEKYLFDFTKERIKRDAKRLLSLTKAITWLYQEQRVIKEIEGKLFVYSEPSDFITAIKIFAGFFNLTYSGLDHRLQRTLDCIKNNHGKHSGEIINLGFSIDYSDWVLRHKIQEELGINSINTIKEHVEKLKDRRKIEAHYDKVVCNKAYLIRGISSGINEVSLPVSLIAIDTLLIGYLQAQNQENIYNNKIIKPIELSFIDDKHIISNIDKGYISGEIDTSKIDMSILQGNIPNKNKVLSFDSKCLVHNYCQFPDGDSICGEVPCNEFEDGFIYCEKHFLEVQKNE